MTYSEAINRVEALISTLEEAKPVSLEDYIEKEKEVRRLLLFCKKKLGILKSSLEEDTEPVNFDE